MPNMPKRGSASATGGCSAVATAIVIPALDEGTSIEPTIRDYQTEFPEARIVVVDNGSTDDTANRALAILRHDHDIFLTEPRRGKGNAIRAALGRLEADVFIMTDGDCTYPASEARKLYESLLATRADMIVGDRVSSGDLRRNNRRFGHDHGNRLLSRIVSALAGRDYVDVMSGLRVMSSPFVGALDVRSTGFQLETELNVIAAYLRATVVEHPIQYTARPPGSKSKLKTVQDGVRILFFAVTNWIAFSPMQFFGLISGLALICSTLLAYRVIAGFIEHGWPYTTTAVAGGTAGLVGILALFLGLSLRILVRSQRRRDAAALLTARRQWNSRLDQLSQHP